METKKLNLKKLSCLRNKFRSTTLKLKARQLLCRWNWVIKDWTFFIKILTCLTIYSLFIIMRVFFNKTNLQFLMTRHIFSYNIKVEDIQSVSKFRRVILKDFEYTICKYYKNYQIEKKKTTLTNSRIFLIISFKNIWFHGSLKKVLITTSDFTSQNV